MASFYSNSENERDTSAILQSREPMPNSYSEGLLSGNMMMYMNNYSSSAGLYTSALPVNTHQQTNCIAIMPGATDSSHSNHQEILSQMGSSRIEGNVLNEWKDSRSNLMLMHQLENAAFQGTQNLQGQGLSLTLGTHVPPGFHMSSNFQNQSSEPGFSSIMCANQSLDGDTNGGRLGNVHSSTTNQESRSFDYMPHGSGVQASNFDLMRSDVSPYGVFNGNRPVPSPKYLKAAQELLDEVVNVKTALKEQNIKSKLMKDSKEIGGSDPNGSGSSPKQQQESSSNSPAELSASEKQELQNKLNKLLEMLDEVDRRYKQYYHQMQIVVSSFDIVAGGSGASKPYTALALQTISRHFRCLRDAITEQIQTARRSLGDQDASTISKGIGISRLRYIDQHIRQGRGIQQLGMMQQHAWRPQRGLPESSVSILRAWLFEHFLHPYPKDSDKMMLARQTGLSRSQVSNWFINARVRLWKPMVEEMYKEELGDVEMDANSPSEFVAANKATSSDAKACEDNNRGDDLQQSTTSTCVKHPSNLQVFDPQSCHLSDAHWTDSRIENTVMETENAYRLGKARQNMNDCNNMLLQDSTFVQSNESNDNRLMAAAYHISELGRFENGGSGVSLTLGLQQCEGGSNVPMSIETHQNYATMRDGMYSTTAPSVEGGEYDCLDSGNRHHRFSSSQLLHDFVA